MSEISTWVPSVEGVASARARLGEPLRSARSSAGLGQVEAAKAGGVSQASLSRAEKGAAELELGVVQKLAGVYGVLPSQVRPRNQYPSAPLDPEARLVWVRERTLAFSERKRADAL